MKKRLLLIGGGGHCASVLDSLLSDKRFDEVAVVDNKPPEIPLACKIVGSDRDLKALKSAGYHHAFVTVGSVGDTAIRLKLYDVIKSLGYAIPNIIDPSAAIANNVQFGEGVYVGKNSVVGARSIIGDCVIVNTAAVVEHDCRIGNFAHLSPSSTLCGSVSIGDATHIGASSVVREGIRIGDHSIIGMGSVVTKNIGNYVTAFGNPCREVMGK